MNIKNIYNYFFYKFYKFSEASPSRWLSDWKAELLLDVFVGLTFFSLMTYYTIYFDRHFKLPSGYIIVGIYILLIALPNYFIFHHKDQWKEIVKYFDQLPKYKNKMGSWIVFISVLLVITNLFFSFYLMSKIDWSQYK
jgi:hypothetical protein